MSEFQSMQAKKEAKKAKKAKTEKKKRRKESSASESLSDSDGSASPEPAQKKAKLSHADVQPDREIRSRPKDAEDPHKRDANGTREPAMQHGSRHDSPDKGSHRKHHSRHDSPSQSPPRHQRQAHDTARTHRSRRHDSPEPPRRR